MFNPFRKRSTKITQQQFVPTQSIEVDISPGGQLALTGMDANLSMGDLVVKMNGHIEKLSTFYERHAATRDHYKDLERLEHSIQSAEAEKTRHKYDKSFINIAEAYEACAVMDERTGAAAWSLAWRTLNQEGLQAVMAVSRGQKESFANSYLDLLFARGVFCNRLMVNSASKQAVLQIAEMSIKMFYTYLLSLRKLGINNWQANDAIKNIHIAKNFAGLSSTRLQAVEASLGAGSLQPVVEQVHAYSFDITDQEQLRQLVF